MLQTSANLFDRRHALKCTFQQDAYVTYTCNYVLITYNQFFICQTTTTDILRVPSCGVSD